MYVDTSVIIKLLVREPETDFFADALEDKVLTSSELALTEVRSALLGKTRSGTISTAQSASAWKTFSAKVEAEKLALHLLDSATLKKANQLLEFCHPTVPLRTLDAIHLAACDLSQDFPLCTSDKRMRDAAKILHIPVFPEEII